MRIKYRTPDGNITVIEIGTRDAALVVGRDRDLSQLVLADAQVSRAHCSLSVSDDGLAVEDLGSRNGSWVNRSRVDGQAVLGPEDVLRIGGTDLWIAGEDAGDSELLVGHQVGGYDLMEVLGRGSYGTVYRGLQVALSRSVAIKVLDRRHKEDPARVESFLTEARRAGRLNHPNVVQVHDVVQADGHYLLVMELMGTSSGAVLRKSGEFHQHEALRIMSDMGKALSYAESQRLVHRDVKPDNILVNDDGIYKLADLGIAAPIASDGQAHQRKTFGSAHYVAPEQARGGAIDGRADIYALGASIYHLLSGEPIFKGSPREVVSHHLNTAPPPLRERADVHPDIAAMVMQLLSKDPDQRPATGAQVAEQADALMEKIPADSSGSIGATGGGGGGARARGRRGRARARARRRR